MPIETIKTILQVDGNQGFSNVMNHLLRGNIAVLYEGSAATLLSTVTSHYPWFLVYNYLDQKITKATTTAKVLLRSAIIGFISSAVSDTVSNCLRVIKTVKQALAAGEYGRKLTYVEVIRHIIAEGGWTALFSRGLATRIVANGLQSIVFTVVWRLLPLYFASRKEEAERLAKEKQEREKNEMENTDQKQEQVELRS
jgi:hypothetical protein